MPLITVSSLQRECNNLQRCVSLHAGHSLSLASDTSGAETFLRNVYKITIDLLKAQVAPELKRPSMEGAIVQLNPDNREHFIFCKLVSTSGGSADVLAFAVGTRSWAYQGMVEITAGREVGGVEWRFHQKIRRALRSFGSYRCMAEGNSHGAFCQGELIGSGLVLFPYLVLRGGSPLEVVPRAPAHLGIIFESNTDCLMGWFADARCAA